jgi:hypothetical protein
LPPRLITASWSRTKRTSATRELISLATTRGVGWRRDLCRAARAAHRKGARNRAGGRGWIRPTARRARRRPVPPGNSRWRRRVCRWPRRRRDRPGPGSQRVPRRRWPVSGGWAEADQR